MHTQNFGHTPLRSLQWQYNTLEEATLKDSASPNEAYSCDLHVLDPVVDGPQVTSMTTGNWPQAQRADPALSLMIERMQDGTLGQSLFKPTSPPELQQFL